MIDEPLVIDKKINNLFIGDRIRILRFNQKCNLQEVPSTSELFRSIISKIENNKAIPSVAALIKITQALGTNISSLLEQNEFLNAIVTSRQKAEDNLAPTVKGIRFTLTPLITI